MEAANEMTIKVVWDKVFRIRQYAIARFATFGVWNP